MQQEQLHLALVMYRENKIYWLVNGLMLIWVPLFRKLGLTNISEFSVKQDIKRDIEKLMTNAKNYEVKKKPPVHSLL